MICSRFWVVVWPPRSGEPGEANASSGVVPHGLVRLSPRPSVGLSKRRGVIRAGDEVVALLTGNGLKTPDARTLGLEPGTGLAPVLRPSLSAFEAWLEARS